MKVTVVLIIVGELWTLPKNQEKMLGKKEIWKIIVIFKITVQLILANILIRISKSREELLSLRLLCKASRRLRVLKNLQEGK